MKKIEDIRLNRFIAMSGVCSRRKADSLIQEGYIAVNNNIVKTVGQKVNPSSDTVYFKGERISPEKKKYILLNKPKGYITTMNDDRGRKTVLSLIKNACNERLVPVGRLDKETTGLLLFTNDGILAKRLMHPKYCIEKTYHVTLNRTLTIEDFKKIKRGILLEDGLVVVDDLQFFDEDFSKIRIIIHIGKNRIIRRLFEFLNYKVKKLDRVSYSFLKKTNLPIGKWRPLTIKELNKLKKDN